MLATFLFVCCVAVACLSTCADEPTADALLKLHRADAAAYSIARDASLTELLQLRSEPVFAWSNPVGYGQQSGHIFVWTYAGRPEVIGTVFSVKEQDKKRFAVHEFHTLSEQRLYPTTPPYNAEKWEPQVGIEFGIAAEVSPPADSSIARLRQLKAIARSFAAKTIDAGGKEQQLRLLTTPLLRYEPTVGKIFDGAIFSMVSSDGTDPEVLLMIEAQKNTTSQASLWRFAAVRFSDKDIQVSRNGEVLWASLTDANQHCAIEKSYRLLFTPRRDYMCYRAHEIDKVDE